MGLQAPIFHNVHEPVWITDLRIDMRYGVRRDNGDSSGESIDFYYAGCSGELARFVDGEPLGFDKLLARA